MNAFEYEFFKKKCQCTVTYNMYEKLIKYKNVKKQNTVCYIDFLQLSALAVCLQCYFITSIF
jgi:hypothetical protein